MAEAVGMGEGTIYPLMRRMQNDGLVSTYLQESASGPPRKYYKLTKSGANVLKAQDLRMGGIRDCSAKILGSLIVSSPRRRSDARPMVRFAPIADGQISAFAPKPRLGPVILDC